MRSTPRWTALAALATLVLGAPAAEAATLTQVTDLLNPIGTMTSAASTIVLHPGDPDGFAQVRAIGLDVWHAAQTTGGRHGPVTWTYDGGGPLGDATTVSGASEGFTELEVSFTASFGSTSNTLGRNFQIKIWSDFTMVGNDAYLLDTLTIAIPAVPPDVFFSNYRFAVRSDVAFQTATFAAGASINYTSITVGRDLDVVPEPMTLATIGLGAGLLALDRRRRRG